MKLTWQKVACSRQRLVNQTHLASELNDAKISGRNRIMKTAARSFWEAFWLAMALVCAAAAAQAQPPRVNSFDDNTDFGISPLDAISSRAAQRGELMDSTSVPSLRTRLIRDRILDERDFDAETTSRDSYRPRTRSLEVEDTPPVPRDSGIREYSTKGLNQVTPASGRRTGTIRDRQRGSDDISLRETLPATTNYRAPTRLPESSDPLMTSPTRSIVPKDPTDDRKPASVPTPREQVDRRYADPRTIRLLDQLTASSAQSLFIEVAQLVDSRHIQPTSYSKRVDRALGQLIIALDSSAFQRATRLAGDERDIGELKYALSQLRDRVVVNDLNDAVSVLNRVQQMFEQSIRIQPGAVGLEFVHAELDTLDQFSMLIPPEKAGGPNIGMKDNVVGIGVEVEAHEQGLKVLKVLPGGPAADVTMKRGDILTAVDGRSLQGVELNQAVDQILGQPGTPVKLNLTRDGRRGDVTLVRRKIALHSVAARMEDDQNKVGYIKLETFSDASVRELDEALVSLHQKGMESLILDLRGNPGGLLTAAISISDRFLPQGTIVQTKGRTPADNTKETAQYAKTWKVPMVVLIDRNSASASEILAAAIQENGRGVIIGERSYGKGTVQTLFPLSSAPAGLRLTTAKFYSPDGREMSGAGVTPDVKVNPVVGNDASDDAAIAKALSVTADPKLIEMARQGLRSGEAPKIFTITASRLEQHALREVN